jgi:hypothetical protein
LHLSESSTLTQNNAEVYFALNEEAENDRLDMHHHLATLLLKGKLHIASIEKTSPQRILDVDCGTGIWSVDIGDAPGFPVD